MGSKVWRRLIQVVVICCLCLTLGGCQQQRGSESEPGLETETPSDVQTAPTEVVLTATAEPATSEPTAEVETSSSVAQLEAMLAYITPAWADFHLPMPFNAAIYYMDVTQMREAMALPPITGASSRQEKLDLIIGLNTQGLGLAPSDLDPLSGGAFDEWGWDIADINQSLYLPVDEITILAGDFSRPEIRARLHDKGYVESSLGTFTLFESETSEVKFALKDDTLVIGPTASELDTVALIIQHGISGQPGLATHPSVAAILPYLGDVSGASLSPAPDFAAMQENLSRMLENASSLHPRVADWLAVAQENAGIITAEQSGWDFMVAAFSGMSDETTLQLIYHYDSENEAASAVEVVRRTLTETPSLATRSATWSDLMSLKSVTAEGELVIAIATTTHKALLGNAIEQRDFYGLIAIGGG